MRPFAMIFSSLWRSKKFRRLETDGARLVYFYLHTHEGGNSLGAFHLSHEVAAIGMKRPAADVLAAYQELQSVGLIRYDEGEEIVQIVDFLDHSPPSSYKHLAALSKIFDPMGEGALKSALALEIVAALEKKAATWSDKIESKRVFNDRAMFLRGVYGNYTPIDTPIDTPIIKATQDTPIDTPIDTQDKTYTYTETETETETIGGGGGGLTERELLLVAMGHDKSGVTATGRLVGSQSDMMVFGQWQNDLGLSFDEITSTIQEVRGSRTYPPQGPFSFKFFNSPMQRLSGQKAEGPLMPEKGNQNGAENKAAGNPRQADRGLSARVKKLRGASLVPDAPE